MTYPSMSAAESRAQATFTALLWAFSHPGRVRGLPADDAFAAIAECLLDLETSYYCAGVELNRRLTATGARPGSPETAQYQFYPALHDDELDRLRKAPTGSYLYPDDGATLVLGCEWATGRRLVLSGPGIRDREVLHIGGVPDAFWPLRAAKLSYPQGWDIVFVCGNQVLGLPRTTVVEAL